MERNIAIRLLILALVTILVFLAIASLLYTGLAWHKDIFKKLVAMFIPPIVALFEWDMDRSRRARRGELVTEVTLQRVLLALACVASYLVVTYFLFETLEMLFLTIPIMAVLSYSVWLRQRPIQHRPPSSK